jgi:hypothetical protein
MADQSPPKGGEQLVEPAGEHERERTQWTGFLALGGVTLVVGAVVVIVLALVVIVYLVAGR